jgi:hypothetical protein
MPRGGEQPRLSKGERTRDHLAKIAARRGIWIERNRYYYGLLNRLRFLWDRRNKFSQFAAYVRQSGRSDWIPVYGRGTTSRTFFLAQGRQ